MAKIKNLKRIEDVLNDMVKENPGNKEIIEEVQEIIDFCIESKVSIDLNKISLK